MTAPPPIIGKIIRRTFQISGISFGNLMSISHIIAIPHTIPDAIAIIIFNISLPFTVPYYMLRYVITIRIYWHLPRISVKRKWHNLGGFLSCRMLYCQSKNRLAGVALWKLWDFGNIIISGSRWLLTFHSGFLILLHLCSYSLELSPKSICQNWGLEHMCQDWGLE